MSLGRLRDIPEVPVACCVDGSVGVLDVSVSGISTPSGWGKLWWRIILKLTPLEVVDFVSPRSSVAPTYNIKMLNQASTNKGFKCRMFWIVIHTWSLPFPRNTMHPTTIPIVIKRAMINPMTTATDFLHLHSQNLVEILLFPIFTFCCLLRRSSFPNFGVLPLGGSLYLFGTNSPNLFFVTLPSIKFSGVK